MKPTTKEGKNMTTLARNLKLRDGVVYGVATINGRQRWKKSPIQGVKVPSPTLLKWRDRWMKEERAKAATAGDMPDKVAHVTWAQLINAYWQVSASENAWNGRPSSETVDENIVKLRTVLSQMKVEEKDALDVVTPERVSAWIAMRATDDRRRYSAMRTLAQATSLWARWTRPRYAALGIVLPECLDRWPKIRALAPKYVDPPDELKRKTVEMGAHLFVEDPAAWLAFAMMFFCGMRPGDAIRARVDWFRKDSNEMLLSFTPNKTRHSACGRSVEQRIESDKWNCMEKAWARSGGVVEWVIPGEEEDDRRKAVDRVNSRMRAIGWTTEKAAYELRKLFVSAIYNHPDGGLKWAAAYSGDNPTTIERYYAAAYRRDAPMVDVGEVVSGV